MCTDESSLGPAEDLVLLVYRCYWGTVLAGGL